MRSYDILFGDEVVGSAEIKEEGLYCKILCRCKLPLLQIYRIKMVSAAKELLLGVCMPKGDEFVLERKLPAKNFTGRDICFYIICADQVNTEFVKIEGREVPIPITELRNMRYCIIDGLPGLSVS